MEVTEECLREVHSVVIIKIIIKTSISYKSPRSRAQKRSKTDS